MRSIAKRNSLSNTEKLSAFTLISVVIFIAVLLIVMPARTAFADSESEILFPSGGYIQTSSPNIISANANYLLVFDETLNKLFVRNSDGISYTYDTDFTNVSQILTAGNSAFIVSDDKYFMLNLESSESSPSEVTIPSPVPSKKSSLSLASDGTYIYAKSVSGCISVYDENLEIAFEADNVYEDILTGRCVFTGSADSVYTFTSNGGTPFFNSYRFGDDEPEEHETDYYVQQAFAADVIFAEQDGLLIIIDPADGSLLKETEIAPDSFCAHGSLLYTTEGSVISVYTYDRTLKDITLTSSISMSGSDNRHLNAPKDVIKVSDMTVVADSGNNRIGFINQAGEMATVSFDSSPIKLTAASDTVYVLCDNSAVYKVSEGAVLQSYTIEGATDITYLDKLYAIKNDGIYTLIGGRFVKFSSIEGGRFITCAKDGHTLYVLTDNSVKTISTDSYQFNTSLSGNFEGAEDFEADFEGSIYILNSGVVTKYRNTLYSLDEEETYKTDSDLIISPVAFALDGENIYIACSECIIIKDAFKSVTSTSYGWNELTPGDEPFFYGEKINPDAFLTDAYGNSDSVRKAPDYALAIYENVRADDMHVLAKTKEGFVLINPSDYKKTEPEKNISIYRTKEATSGYTDLLSAASEIPADTELTALFQQRIDGTDYIRTTYSDTEYFVSLSCLEIVREIEVDPEPETPAEPEKKYARIKSRRIGTKVNIYLNPSEDSPVVFQLVDGKRVEVLSESEDYCLVSYEGQEGYILKSSLQFKGLTTVQTVAIVLSVIVLIAGTVIALSFYWQKKQQIG